MEDKTYNLRSKKNECSIPIQLQLASDEDFMAALRPSTFGQVSYSEHTDSSDSDIDKSDMINNSDQNFRILLVKMWRVPLAKDGVDHSCQNDHSVSQNDINRQILAQLSNLGDHLGVIECSTSCNPYKKTSDVGR